MVKQRHQLFVALLCAADGLVIVAACMIAWLTRRHLVEGSLPGRWEHFVRDPALLVVVPVVLLSLWLSRLYTPRRDRSVWPEVAQIVRTSFLSIGAVILVLWSAGSSLIRSTQESPTGVVWGYVVDANRLQIWLLALLLPVMLSAHRVTFRLVLRMIRRRGRNLRHVLVIGTGRLGQIAARTLDRNPWTGIHVSAFLSHHDRTKRNECLGRPVLGGVDDLERVVAERRPDAVYLAIPTARAAVIPVILKRLERYVLDVRLVPDVHPRYLPQNMAVSELDGMPILSVRESPLYGLGGISKRVLDFVGAIAALVLLSPVMLAAALLVKRGSPGPVIFKQQRVGLNGTSFEIYKFRTMYHVEDETGPATWTERDDPRVTPVGRWLRRTSIDELPQLFNVLRGDMSLVGPRPERPELIERFREDWRGYMLRQHVKAGMTGWAQVNGLRGNTSLRKRLQYDLFYIRHWSIGFDIQILWLTLFRGWLHPNAH